MEFVNDNPSCRFTVKDAPTVRDQLTFWDTASNQEGYIKPERWWNATKLLIQEWECELFPDPHTDLDEVTDPLIVNLV